MNFVFKTSNFVSESHTNEELCIEISSNTCGCRPSQGALQSFRRRSRCGTLRMRTGSGGQRPAGREFETQCGWPHQGRRQGCWKQADRVGPAAAVRGPGVRDESLAVPASSRRLAAWWRWRGHRPCTRRAAIRAALTRSCSTSRAYRRSYG